MQCVQISFPESMEQDGECSGPGGAGERHSACLATQCGSPYVRTPPND